MHPAVGLQPPVLGPSSCLVQRALAHAQHARSLLAPWRFEDTEGTAATSGEMLGLGLGLGGLGVWAWVSPVNAEAFIANMAGILKGPDHQTLLAFRPSKNRTCSEPGPHCDMTSDFKGQRLTFRTGSLAPFQLLKHASCLLLRSLYLTLKIRGTNTFHPLVYHRFRY